MNEQIRQTGQGMLAESVTLTDELDLLADYWSQRVVAEANGSLFKVAKGIGATRWHSHENEDEVFLLIEGELVIQLRDGDVHMHPGDLYVVPRGVEHCPFADFEARFLIVGQTITSNAAGGKPIWSYRGGAPSRGGEAQPVD